MLPVGLLEWPALAALVALIASAFSIVTQWHDRIIVRGRSDAVVLAAVEEAKAVDKRCAALELALADHKLLSSQIYASSASLERIEARLFQALDGV